MNIVATDQGALNILTDALGLSPSMAIRLFDNNATVDHNAVLGDFNEASFSGYFALTPTWTTPTLVGGVPQTTISPSPQAFTYTGVSTTTVYGVYLTDSAGTKLYGATKFASPITLSTIVTQLNVAPIYTAKEEFSTS